MLTTDQLALLRSNGQRYRLYFAKWGTWEIQQSTPLLSDASTTPPTLQYLGTKTQSNVKPLVNIGPNRLGFVGEALTFDARKSFHIHNNSVSSCTWSFPDATPTSSSSLGPVSVTWADPGLYEITCTIEGQTATRFVRIHANRSFNVYDVAAVQSVSGANSGGWKATITVAPSDDVAGVSSETVDLVDFQAVGIFIEEEYEVAGTWTLGSVSGYDLEPKLLVSGYIEQGSIHVDANNHTIQFQLSSVSDQMNIGYINATQTWNKVYIDADKAAPTPTLPDPVQGVVLDMSPDAMVMPDIIVWWLQTYTNVLERHDFYTWYDASQQTLDAITTSEGSMWSAFGALADNEFAWWFCDQGCGIHFEPNPHIRSQTWWNSNYPVKTTLLDDDVITYDITQDMMRNVIWTQLTGTQVRTGKQWTVRYPGDTPGSGAGTWYMKNDLNISRKSFLDAIIANVYNDQNRKITINVTMALNRAFSVPDSLYITTDIPDRSLTWTNKHFTVNSVTYNINVPQGQFTTQLSLLEFV